MRYENWYDNPHAILIDFGISTTIRDEDELGLTMTSNPGTKYFMAPEYIEKSHFDTKSDVFAIGVSLICILTADYFMLSTAVDCKEDELILKADQLGGAWPKDILYDFATLISRSASTDPKDRPTVEALLEGLSSLRERNGAFERLPLFMSRRITTHLSTALYTKTLAVVDKPMSCVLCDVVSERGIVCSNHHFICSEDACLEALAREYIGCETLPCPGKCCSESFYLRDLFDKMNADVYGELVVAVDRSNEYQYFVDAIKRKLDSLRIMLVNLFEDSEMISTKLDHADTSPLPDKLVDESIVSMKILANNIEQEGRLQFEKGRVESRLKYGILCGATDGSQNELDTIIQQLEELKLSDAGEINLLSKGQIQCPPLFVLIPVVTASMKESRFKLHANYRMYFLCSHDYSWVESPITLKQPKAWFCKIVPLLKWSTVVLRLLVSVKSGALTSIRPKNMQDIVSSTGFRSDHLIDDVLGHMEYLLYLLGGELEDVKKRLDACLILPDVIKLVHDYRMVVSREVYGTIAVQAYKPGNIGWLEHMEFVRNGTECSWVKRRNVKAWKRTRIKTRKPLEPA